MVRLIVLLSICTFLFGNANHVEARQEPLIPNLPDLSVATDQPFHPTWNCTIRGWVRAPDLSPVSSTPGEARLAANGSQCGDIASWAVGLRFKERAIAKLRNASIIEFPKKPVRLPYNSSAHMSVDYEDIFQSQGMYYPNRDAEFDDAMIAYNLAISDPSLWDVKGVEREVFDTQIKLLMGAEIQKEEIDIVRSFFVHTPATNFPPMEDTRYSESLIKGAEQELLNAESLFEYYLNVTLANGSSIDVPSGRAGFLPTSVDLPERLWPQSRALISPRLIVGEKNEDSWSNWDNDPPTCDKDNLARFNLTISPNIPFVTQGGNLTLNLKLTRSGNGSEYPSVLNIYYSTEKELDWARSRLNSVVGIERGPSAYEDLVRNKKERGGRMYRHIARRSGRMLIVKPMEQLIKERKRQENAEGLSGGSTSYSSIHLGPMIEGQSRYNFEADTEIEMKDTYDFSVEIQVPQNALPSFNGTFHSFRPQLQFDLHTTFLCVVDPIPDLSSTSNSTSEANQRDLEWMEAELPIRSNNNRNRRQQYGLTHTTSVDIDVVLLASRTDSNPVLAYTDSSAQGIVLSTETDIPASGFPVLNQTIRHESARELKSSRYGRDRLYDRYSMCGSRRCNFGGALKHAAKLWQEREILGTSV